MITIKPKETFVVYDNPIPVLRSRHGYFPGLAEMPDGSLCCAFVLAEAFESVDGTTRMMRSVNGGATWELMPPVYDKTGIIPPTSDSMKLTVLSNGRILLFGYEFGRENPELPVGNPLTGGLLDDSVIIMESYDGGNTFVNKKEIRCAWGPHVEASAPMYELQDGSLATPVTGFNAWDGTFCGIRCGRLLRSFDGGDTFSDDVICMRFADERIGCFEQRMAQTDSGMLVNIGWNENLETGERLNNHYTISTDNGETFSDPLDTGVRGQASSVTAIGGERVIAIHAVRRDTDRPGIYGYVADVTGGGWQKESEPVLLWEPALPIKKDTKMAEIFSFLKFGQPNVTRLKNGRLIMTHWAIENGQGIIYATDLHIS